MNFKALSLKLAMTAATVASAALLHAPAEAATLGDGTLNLSGRVRLEVNGNTSTLNFADRRGNPFNTDFGVVNVTSGRPQVFKPLADTRAIFRDLTLQRTTRRRWVLTAPVDEFISFANGVKFQLEGLRLRRRAGRGWIMRYEGFFYDSSGVIDGFSQVVNLRGLRLPQGAEFDMPIVAGNGASVPTPALVPGLLALGVGVLRKRQTEEEQTTEVIEVKA